MANKKKYSFLVADDEFPIVKIITDILAIHPNTSAVFTANDGERAIYLYENNPIDIVITDILMPRLSGIDLIKKLKKINNDIHIIVVSAYSNIDLVREAIRGGAYDYILKPFSMDEIMFAVNRVIDRLKLLEERKNYVSSLENKIKEVTADLRGSFFETLSVILNLLEAKSKTTMEHSNNVANLAEKLARLMNFDEEKIENIKIGAKLHDIGKIGIPDNVLLKPSILTKEEFEIVKNHPILGRNIVSPILNISQDILDFIYYHHERFDGSGYPVGLKGEDIPIAARIANVTNSYVAMTTSSEFKEEKTKKEAVLEIENNIGRQFDPEIARLFLDKILSG